MSIAIVAGMPNNQARRFKQRIDGMASYQTWDMHWVPSREKQPVLGTCWPEVMNIADAASESGVHILAYHKAINERDQYEEEVRFRHRLVWLDHKDVFNSKDDQWLLDIKQRLRIEDAWRKDVRPSHHHHALVLPHGTFTSSRDPWTTAQRAETERGVSRAQSEIKEFERSHRHKGRWKDENGLVFDSGGPNHGRAPLHRQWKFTYLLPPGFHFDVCHESGQSFKLVDAGGARLSFSDYTNVDAHGHVRGGH